VCGPLTREPRCEPFNLEAITPLLVLQNSRVFPPLQAAKSLKVLITSCVHNLTCSPPLQAAKSRKVLTTSCVYLCMLVQLVIYDSGWVSLEHLLLSRHPFHQP